MEEIIEEIKQEKKYKDLLEESSDGSSEGKDLDIELLGELCDLIKIKIKDSLLLNTVIDIFIEDNEKNKEESASFKNDMQDLLYIEITGLLRCMASDQEYKSHIYKIHAINSTLTSICSKNIKIENKEDAEKNNLIKDIDSKFKKYLQNNKDLDERVNTLIKKYVKDEKIEESKEEIFTFLSEEILGFLGIKEHIKKEMEKCIIL